MFIILDRYGRKNKPTKFLQKELPLGHDSITIKGNGMYQLEVVGESYYQDALEQICGPRTDEGVEMNVIAEMVWDNNNPMDNLAVRIDIEGKTVGHLSKPFARLIRETMAEAGYEGVKKYCNAIIRGGWDRGKGDKGHYGVRLDFPLYDSSKEERPTG
jgi:hypothetical protein